MDASPSLFIGIDPSAGRRAISYAALDADMRVYALGSGGFEEVLDYVGEQGQAIVGLNAPRRPSLGLVEGAETRVVEQQLRERDITVPFTASEETSCKPWMRRGFALYHRLERLGYQPYPDAEAGKQYLEVSPLACYHAWLGKCPFPKRSLEGRLQRQLLLCDLGLNLPDPMRFFEEITKHRLLKGILPDEALYSPEELEAFVIAYTARLAALSPGRIELIGEVEEGQIAVPVELMGS